MSDYSTANDDYSFRQTKCEVCGKEATQWVRDLFRLYTKGVGVAQWQPGKWHAFCDRHQRKSRQVDAASGKVLDDGIHAYE